MMKTSDKEMAPRVLEHPGTVAHRERKPLWTREF
jgi:hypothetical protein